MNEIIWHSKNEFWNIFDSDYKPNKRFLERFGYFKLPLEELKKWTTVRPVNSPDDEDFAGPVERWYCESENHLFLVTYYYTEDHQIRLAMEDDKEVVEIVKSVFSQNGIIVETYGR
jgi:hypothetical protein